MKQQAFYGLLISKKHWTISPTAKWLTFVFAIVAIVVTLGNLYSILAITQRVPCDLLVIEGWMPTALLNKAAAEYLNGGYNKVLVLRGYYDPDTAKSEQPQDDYILPMLAKYGIPYSCLETVLFSSYQKDETLNAALALTRWFQNRRIQPRSFNVLADGASSRRTLLLYRKVFRRSVRIGTVSVDDPSFDGRHWWRSSQGVRDVLFEGIAYSYVLLTFSAVQ